MPGKTGHTATPGSSDENMDKQSVSLVLGSGAARGLAHIGVIEWLEEQGYRIESIAGASMGALVGGIYAAGKLDVYRDWVLGLDKMDVIRFLDLEFSAAGLFKGDRLMDALRELVGEHTIEDLPIGYTAVACDIDRQREIWLTRGSLFSAIRSSIAIPLIFKPYHYRGMRLLDGGLLNPVPIAPTFRDMTDLTIAVDLNGAREGGQVHALDPEDRTPPESPEQDGSTLQRLFDTLQDSIGQRKASDLGLFDLLGSAFETMQNAISVMKLASYAPDVHIRIPRSTCKAYEFDRAAELIELGRDTTARAMASRDHDRRREKTRHDR